MTEDIILAAPVPVIFLACQMLNLSEVSFTMPAWCILLRPNQLVHPNPPILRVATSVKQGSAVLPWAAMIPPAKVRPILFRCDDLSSAQCLKQKLCLSQSQYSKLSIIQTLLFECRFKSHQLDTMTKFQHYYQGALSFHDLSMPATHSMICHS